MVKRKQASADTFSCGDKPEIIFAKLMNSNGPLVCELLFPSKYHTQIVCVWVGGDCDGQKSFINFWSNKCHIQGALSKELKEFILNGAQSKRLQVSNNETALATPPSFPPAPPVVPCKNDIDQYIAASQASSLQTKTPYEELEREDGEISEDEPRVKKQNTETQIQWKWV